MGIRTLLHTCEVTGDNLLAFALDPMASLSVLNMSLISKYTTWPLGCHYVYHKLTRLQLSISFYKDVFKILTIIQNKGRKFDIGVIYRSRHGTIRKAIRRSCTY